MKASSLLFPSLWLSLALLPRDVAAESNLNLACKRLCERQSDCVRRCLGHVELFELNSDLVQAAADWAPTVERRMQALRSGANLEILDICKKTGWSMDNMVTCLRTYPTPELIRSCKKLSPLQDEQVRCIRAGKPSAAVDSCALLVPGSDQRLLCVETNVTWSDIDRCNRPGSGSESRMRCLRDSDGLGAAREARARAARAGRTPASPRDRE